jgi:hypothetical protein
MPIFMPEQNLALWAKFAKKGYDYSRNLAQVQQSVWGIVSLLFWTV